MANYRDWPELPRDVTLTILMKLPQLNVLKSVQFVCKPWYDLCKEPFMWRTIKLYNFRKPKKVLGDGYKSSKTAQFKMVLNAIDRSAGGLIDLEIFGFLSCGLCSYLASRSTQLKCLRLVCCEVSSEDFIEGLPKLSSLNELEFTLCYFRIYHPGKLISIIKSCPPSITTFKLNGRRLREPDGLHDEVASTIAENLPQLRHLQLRENDITNVGVTAILDRFSRLQSLDLCLCFHLNLKGDLGKRLSKQVIDFKATRLPT